MKITRHSRLPELNASAGHFGAQIVREAEQLDAVLRDIGNERSELSSSGPNPVARHGAGAFKVTDPSSAGIESPAEALAASNRKLLSVLSSLNRAADLIAAHRATIAALLS